MEQENINELKNNLTLARQREALLANLRSEFSTPIDVIVGYTQILLDEISESGSNQFSDDLKKILLAGQLLQTNVDELLDFTSFSSKKPNFDFKTFGSDLQFSLLTPLNSIIGYCEMILEEKRNSIISQTYSDVGKVHRAAKLFIKYIHDIDRLAQAQRKGTDLLSQFRAAGLTIHELITSIPPLEKGFAHQAPKYKGSILVVDDNMMARDLLIRRITHYGFSAVPCGNPNEVLDKISIVDFDLVLVEIIMAGRSGFEVLKEIKKHKQYCDIPVIVISPLKEIDAIVRCLELGADDYLIKPFNSIIFKTRIAASIEKKILHDKEKAYLGQLQREKAKSENLLLNIVPSAVAVRLKRGETNIVEKFNQVTVVFVDIVDFSKLTELITPEELIVTLNLIFSVMDQLTDKYSLEKIKTIGDCYMAVCGAPIPNQNDAEMVADFSLAILDEIKVLNKVISRPIEIRVGIHSGPVVAGVIGKKKFVYDLWGGVVNIASRLQSEGLPGRIQVSESTYDLLKDQFLFEQRGTIEAKGIGKLKTYFLLGRASGEDIVG